MQKVIITMKSISSCRWKKGVEKMVSQFFEVLILSGDFWRNIHHVHEINLISWWNLTKAFYLSSETKWNKFETFLLTKDGILEILNSGHMVWMFGLWTARRLDSGQLDAWTLDTLTLVVWTLGLWTFAIFAILHLGLLKISPQHRYAVQTSISSFSSFFPLLLSIL